MIIFEFVMIESSKVPKVDHPITNFVPKLFSVDFDSYNGFLSEKLFIFADNLSFHS